MDRKTLRQAENDIAAGLVRLTADGGSNNFMIVSADEYYVQFAGTRGETTVFCEAVSDAYLSGRQRLSLERINELKRRGFSVDDTENFSRTFELAGEDDARKLARMTVEIMARVYGCPGETDVKIQLNLE